jgi:hypothetical protein
MFLSFNAGSGPAGLHLATLSERDPRGLVIDVKIDQMGVWPFGVEAVNRGDQCPTLPRQLRFADWPRAFEMSGTLGYGRRVAAKL